jgi:hypothetical protein
MNNVIYVFLLQTINFLDFHGRFDLLKINLRDIYSFAFDNILIFDYLSWLLLSLLSFDTLFFFHFLYPECDLILDLLFGVFDGLNLIVLRISLS